MNLPEGCWIVLHTRPASEEMVRASLLSKGYDVFLPERLKQHRSRSAPRSPIRPLFPGYVFCRVNLRAPGKVVSTPGVIRILGVGGTPCPVGEQEIENIKILMRSGSLVQPWRYLKEDSTVEIMNGPLRGVRGTVVKSPQSNRIVVSVNLLRRSVSVTLDGETELTVLPNPTWSDCSSRMSISGNPELAQKVLPQLVASRAP